MKRIKTPKKKILKMALPVRDFMRGQDGVIKKELNGILYGGWRSTAF